MLGLEAIGKNGYNSSIIIKTFENIGVQGVQTR